MSLKYIWKSHNNKESQEYIEQKIKELINENNIFDNKALSAELSLNGPLDRDLSGIIKDDENNIICTFTSNEFLDKLILTYPEER